MGVGGRRPTDSSCLQVTVVAKYLFQFGFFPWNSHAVLRRYENKPYFPPRILGLEKSDSYVKCDLPQLIVLFFHRAQLLVSTRAAQGRCLPHTHTRAQHTRPCRAASRARTRGHTAHMAARTPSHLAPRQAGCREAQRGPGHLAHAMCCPVLPRRPSHQPRTSLHSATASGTTTRTLSRRSVTGVVGRTRRLRRSRPCWDPSGSQGWPGPPLRTTSRWKPRTGPQSPVTRGSACVSGRGGRRAQDPENG